MKSSEIKSKLRWILKTLKEQGVKVSSQGEGCTEWTDDKFWCGQPAHICFSEAIFLLSQTELTQKQMSSAITRGMSYSTPLDDHTAQLFETDRVWVDAFKYGTEDSQYHHRTRLSFIPQTGMEQVGFEIGKWAQEYQDKLDQSEAVT